MKKSLSIFGLLLAMSFAQVSHGSDPVRKNMEQRLQVVDFSNLETLPGAMIKIAELDMVFYSDFDGFVNLNEIPEGDYTVEVHIPSYKVLKLEDLHIGPKAKPTKLRIKSVTS